MRKSVQVLKRISKGKLWAHAGVTFGPEAGKKTDASFEQFKDEQFGAFKKAVAPAKTSTVTSKYGGVAYERIITLRGGKGATAMVGIKDGRCVAFWFMGANECFDALIKALPLAKPK